MQTAAPIELASNSLLDRLFPILLARLVISYKFFSSVNISGVPCEKSLLLSVLLVRSDRLEGGPPPSEEKGKG